MSIPTSSQTSPSPEDKHVYKASPAPTVGTDVIGAVSNAQEGEALEALALLPFSGGANPIGGRLRDGWRLITQNRKVAVGLCILVLFLLVALFGPFFAHYDPNALNASDQLSPPSADHWLGTTQTGQDVFSQLMYGTRTSLFWAFVTSLSVAIISIVVGMAAGYFGGVIDDVLSVLMNVFLVLPSFALAIVIAAFIFKGSLAVAMVIAITGWAYGARVLRAQTMSMRSRDFVEAAKSSGETTFRIIFFEIFPNEIAIVVASLIGTIIYVILAAAGLEFLGLGDPANVSWGTMLYWAQNSDAILLGAWWWFLPPGLSVAFLGTGLALINSSIDEFANPRLRSEPKPKAVKAKKVVAE